MSRPRLAVALILLAACGGEAPPANAPPPPAPPRDPAWLAGASRACTMIASCTTRDAARLRDPSACVDWWTGQADTPAPDTLRKCLEEAKTCDQVNTCMGGGGDARAASFCMGRAGVVAGCDGNRLVSCSDDESHEATVMDCAALGASCREVKATGGLVLRACFAPDKCPAGAPEARCDGSAAVISCRDGAIERTTCVGGTRCEERRDENGDSIASCEIPGRRCTSSSGRRCEGDRLVECSGARQSAKLRVSDCASVGLHCAGRGPRTGCYVPSNVECDREMLPKCEEGAVVFCAAGRITKVSCSSLGMGPCSPSARGAMAACLPPQAASPGAK